MHTQDFIVFFYISSETLYMGGYTALIINTHHEEVATVDNWQSHVKTEVAQCSCSYTPFISFR